MEVDTVTFGRSAIISSGIGKQLLGAQGMGGGFSETPMMHLGPQVQQFGGFEHGRRVFGRDPKIPIGDGGNPIFSDFTHPEESHKTQTHHLL